MSIQFLFYIFTFINIGISMTSFNILLFKTIDKLDNVLPKISIKLRLKHNKHFLRKINTIYLTIDENIFV